jgi:hypothetical protein
MGRENKSKVRIFSGGGHRQSAEILKGILRHIEIQRRKKFGLGRERFTLLGKSDKENIRWT